MTNKVSNIQLKSRRGELLAELFLQELKPSILARPTDDFGYDFLVGFQNTKGGINNYIVEVKATENPLPPRFLIQKKLYDRLAHSNIPGILLVVDIKQNRLAYALFEPKQAKHNTKGMTTQIMVDIEPVEGPVKEELHKKLAA